MMLEIEESDRFSGDKFNILEQEMLDSRLKIDLEADSSLEFDPMLMQFSRLKSIEGKDAFILEACFANTVWDQLSMPFSKNNEIKATQMLLDICVSSLGGMIEDVSFDTNSDSPHNLTAKLRKQERRALQGTIKKIRKCFDTAQERI